ncbi:septum site-determining protein MinC [Methylocapsa aurea]|uniref:septum site-determining protein MinC n=1 Tax=Methylocapsa aurea TaxID=663610 RepID=UPI00055F17D1|nr:septum site-determining protein MinC [Methylocapsa aurea]
MTAVTRPRHSIRFHSRSYHAMALAPEPPVANWLAELDAWLERSPGFFASRPIVLDLFSRKLSKSDVESLTKDLLERKIQVLGLEGADPSFAEFGLPPLLTSGVRPANAIADVPDDVNDGEPVAAPVVQRPNSLLLDSPVRSGQYIEHLQGDVIVIGSVASGAEVIAGGSIHIYGTLRGRAIAGAGDPRARIFCRKLEAELLAIDGLYMTADDMEPQFRGRSVRVWLDGNTVMMTAQD